MLQKLKMLGLLLVVIGVSIIVGFRVKLYADGQKQEAIKTNFRNLCKAYQEKYIGDDGSAYIGNMEEYVPLTGDTIAIITIPEIGIDVSVVEGIEKEDIKLNIGHFPQTDMPWVKGGNFAVAGHSSIVYNCLFNDLHEAEEGMKITIQTQYGTYNYKITQMKVVESSDVSVLDRPTDGSTICTLTTCINSGKQRLIVVGTLENK